MKIIRISLPIHPMLSKARLNKFANKMIMDLTTHGAKIVNLLPNSYLQAEVAKDSLAERCQICLFSVLKRRTLYKTVCRITTPKLN